MLLRSLSRHFYGDFTSILKTESFSAHSSFIDWKTATGTVPQNLSFFVPLKKVIVLGQPKGK